MTREQCGYLIGGVIAFVAFCCWLHVRLEKVDARYDEIRAEQQRLEIRLQDNQKQLLEELKRIEGVAREASFTTCNGAPYSIQVAVAYPVSATSVWLEGYYTLEPGGCHSIVKQFNGFAREFYSFAVAQVDARVQWFDESVVAHTEVARPALSAGQTLYFHGSDLVVCADETAALAHAVAREDAETCAEGMKLIGFTKAARKKTSFREWAQYFGHPSWLLAEVDSGNPLASRAVIEQRAPALAASIAWQMEAEKYFHDLQPDVLFGAELVDFNSNLNPGVLLQNIISTDIFDAQQNIAEGDLLTAVNGHPIFSTAEAMYWLAGHAQSPDGGIGVALDLTVVRPGCESGCLVKATYFFNPNTLVKPGGIEAGYWGISDGVLFGFGEAGNCVVGNVLKGVANIGLGCIELIASTIQERSFDKRSLHAVPYHDLKQCTWFNAQRSAFARQLHPEMFSYAETAALFTPGGIRLLFAKGMRRQFTGMVGKGALAGILTNVSLEATESAVWAVGSSPPTADWPERIRRARAAAPEGAGIGFVTAVLPRIGK